MLCFSIQLLDNQQVINLKLQDLLKNQFNMEKLLFCKKLEKKIILHFIVILLLKIGKQSNLSVNQMVLKLPLFKQTHII